MLFRARHSWISSPPENAKSESQAPTVIGVTAMPQKASCCVVILHQQTRCHHWVPVPRALSSGCVWWPSLSKIATLQYYHHHFKFPHSRPNSHTLFHRLHLKSIFLINYAIFTSPWRAQRECLGAFWYQLWIGANATKGNSMTSGHCARDKGGLSAPSSADGWTSCMTEERLFWRGNIRGLWAK